MPKFRVTFTDEIEAETIEDAYQQILDYLAHTSYNGDVTAFDFEEIEDEGH